MTTPTKRHLRFVSIEPGRISLHGIALTDGEYAVLRGIAERMKRAEAVREAAAAIGNPDWINEVPTC
jgi:hypothetical protein